MTSPHVDAVRAAIEQKRAKLLEQAEIENVSNGPCSGCRHSFQGHWLEDGGQLLCDHPLLVKQVFNPVTGVVDTVQREQCRNERTRFGKLCKTEGHLFEPPRVGLSWIGRLLQRIGAQW